MAKVAIVQMVSGTNVSDNLQQVGLLLQQAREQNANLVVLPENFAFMGMNDIDKLKVAEKSGEGQIQDQIRMWAQDLGLWIIAGTIPIQAGKDKVRAACIVYDDLGEQVARYDKIHLFDVRVSDVEAHQESKTIEPGDELVVVDTPIGRVGLTICYDLRFPEIYYQLLNKGAQIFTVPSAFTAVTGMVHWEILLRARAIENLGFVLAPNQGGEHKNGRRTFGHSMIVDPWGKVIIQKEAGIGMITAEIDLERVHYLRQHFPSVSHHVLV